jgi:NADPH:quinone reductase-like Zn-dependent oxidoreductase
LDSAEVLKCEEHEVAAPAPGEVQVRVEAIGISWYDVLWRQNLAPSHTLVCPRVSAMKWRVLSPPWVLA